jgi:putative PIN family toxin of toxin-antitoxin system
MSISRRSEHYWLWQAFRDRKIILCYTTEILLEYFEVLSRFFSVPLAKEVIDTIISARHSRGIEVYFHWNLITADLDDNKLVDCAVCANARYIVSNDKHFDILEAIDFPKVDILTIEEFKEIIQ